MQRESLTQEPRRPVPSASALLAAILLVAGAAIPAAVPAAADFEQCWNALEASRWKAAIPCFEALVGEHPGWAWGHQYLGVALHGDRQLDRALAAFEKAAELMPGDEAPSFDPYFNGAKILEAKGQHAKALAFLDRGQPLITPEAMPEYLHLRGVLRQQLGQSAAAIDDLRRSGRRDFSTLYTLGLAEFGRGDAVAASEYLEEAQAAQPGHVPTARLLAQAYFQRAEQTADTPARRRLYQRSATASQVVVKAEPRVAESRNLLARALLGAGDQDGARREFERLLEIEPGHCHARANLTQVEVARGRWDAALQHGAEAIKCLPAAARPDVHVAMGHALLGRGKAVGDRAGEGDVARRQEAIGIYRQALDHFQKAQAGRAADATRQLARTTEATIKGFEDAIATIRRNQGVEEANRQAAEEEARQRRLIEEARQQRGGTP